MQAVLLAISINESGRTIDISLRSVHITRAYRPCSRMSNKGVILDIRVRGPCYRAPVHVHYP